MTADGQFFIDGKPYKLEHSPAKVAALLHLAGTSASESILVSKDGVEHGNPDELIDIAPGDEFWIKKRDDSEKPVDKPIRYTVNGEANETVRVHFRLRPSCEMRGPGPP